MIFYSHSHFLNSNKGTSNGLLEFISLVFTLPFHLFIDVLMFNVQYAYCSMN